MMNGSEPEAQGILCLFLVVVDHDGSSRVVLNPDERFIAVRAATPKDVYPALANVLADFQGLKTAEAIVGFQMQLARQQMASQEDSEAPQEPTQPPVSS